MRAFSTNTRSAIMKNKDIERYTLLSDAHKAELRNLRNKRKNGKLDRKGQRRMRELMANGRK